MNDADQTNSGSQSFNVVGQGLSATGQATVHVRDLNIHNHGPQPVKQVTLKDALWFKHIRRREQAIDDAHSGTCAWLLNTSQYLSWRTGSPTEWHHRLLWIKGNAGAGKSTMMKFAVEHARRISANELILPHFFNARGTALEQSAEGMYRTLLIWMLEALPPGVTTELNAQYREGTAEDWQIPELARLLKRTVREFDTRPVTFYIDALDECDDDEVRTMIRVFRDLVQEAWSCGRLVRVCFASRPYPRINFTHVLFLDFSLQEEHIRDIASYIEAELQIGHSALARDVRDKVRRKAAGSFMWAVLVVRILNREHDRGRMHHLGQRIQEIPAGLHDLYNDLLERYPADQDAMLACCRTLLFAKRDLCVEELWWATQWELLRDQAGIHHAYSSLEQTDMERYIIDVSKGLIEFSKARDFRAQFLHESVRDFLLDSAQVSRFYGAEDRRDFEAQSHATLRDCCAATLEAEKPRMLSIVQTEESYNRILLEDLDPWKAWQLRDTSIPAVISYAAQFVLVHAEQAQRLGLDQTIFIADFAQRCGPPFLSFSEREGVHHGQGINPIIKADSSALSLLTRGGYHRLIRSTQLKSARDARRRGKAFGLMAADNRPRSQSLLCFSDQSVVDAITDIYLRLEDRHPRLQRVLQHFAKERSLEPFPMSDGGSLLELSWSSPALSIFFLLSMAKPGNLEPHLDSLEAILAIDAPKPRVDIIEAERRCTELFVNVLYFFVEQDLHSDAIIYDYEDIIRWVDQTSYIIIGPPENSTCKLFKLEALCSARIGRLSGLISTPCP